MEGELSATRQWLDAPLDSFWQFGPRAVLGWGWGHGSELALAYQYSRLDYDNREQVDRTGAPIANTMLALNTHVAELVADTRLGSRRSAGKPSLRQDLKPRSTTVRGSSTTTVTAFRSEFVIATRSGRSRRRRG